MYLEKLPLFPLHVVLFPGMLLPLHIFEERYKRMMSDCLDGESRFGVACIHKGAEVGGPAEVYPVGTLAHVLRVGRYPDGRMDCLTLGLRRFRIIGQDDQLPYLRADVKLLDDEPIEGHEPLSKAETVVRLLKKYRLLLGLEEREASELPQEVEAVSFAAALLDLPLEEKQLMLESQSASERLDRLAAVLKREIELCKRLGPTRTIWGGTSPRLR